MAFELMGFMAKCILFFISLVCIVGVSSIAILKMLIY